MFDISHCIETLKISEHELLLLITRITEVSHFVGSMLELLINTFIEMKHETIKAKQIV